MFYQKLPDNKHSAAQFVRALYGSVLFIDENFKKKIGIDILKIPEKMVEDFKMITQMSKELHLDKEYMAHRFGLREEI